MTTFIFNYPAYHVGLIAYVFSVYVGTYVGRLFRAILAIGAEEAWRLSTLELLMRVEIVLPIEDAVAIRARILVGILIERGRF